MNKPESNDQESMDSTQAVETVSAADGMFSTLPEGFLTKKRVLIAGLILLLMLGIASTFLWLLQAQTPHVLPVSVTVDGEAVSADALLLSQGDSVLLDASRLLALLQETKWHFYTLPRKEFRFQDAQGNTAGMKIGSTQAQFYTSASNALATLDTGGTAVLKQETALIPLSFAQRWLNLEIAYEEQALDIIRLSDPLPEESPLPEEPAPPSSQETISVPVVDDPVISSAESSSLAESTASADGASSAPDTERMDCSYTVNDKELTVYAEKIGDEFQFTNEAGKRMGGNYAAIGSVSQPELLTYLSPDGKRSGVITGLPIQGNIILYGVISFEREAQWVVPCSFTDIWKREDGRFVGQMYGGGIQLLP